MSTCGSEILLPLCRQANTQSDKPVRALSNASGCELSEMTLQLPDTPTSGLVLACFGWRSEMWVSVPSSVMGCMGHTIA